MPEKPKRRKNNKNKRKNKNSNRPDLHQNNNSDAIESDVKSDIDTCVQSVQSELVDNIENADLRMENSPENISYSNVLMEEQKCVVVQTQNLNQDLNNNSAAGGSTNRLSPTISQDLDVQQTVDYTVESPEQSLKTKTKLNSKIKSKSLDNDEQPKIEEIVDETCSEDVDDNTMAIIDSNVLVSDVESDIEWEKTEEAPDSNVKELVTGKLSITSIPLSFAQCEQTKSLTPDEEISLRHYLETLNLSSKSNVSAVEIKTEIEQIINQEIRHRLRKKGLAEDFTVARLAPARILDVIDEESGESSLTSRRQSYLSDKKSDNDDLEDDVFIEPKSKPPIPAKPTFIKNQKPFTRLIPQECVLVGAKIKDQEIAEARGEWSVQTVEKMKGAEVVYLTDSSSSTSSIHEIEGDKDNDDEGTDLSVRIVTPTIEVTDADSLLKESFLADSKDDFKTVNNKIKKLTENLKIDSEDQNQQKIQIIDKINENINPHEIVVSSIDDIKTDLYVKDIEERKQAENDVIKNTGLSTATPKINTDYDQDMKVIKSELNNAINNLIKEVSSDSENNENPKENFVRQDSSSSIGSSQCTAKYNPTYSSLNDVSNIMHDDVCEISKLTPSRPEESNLISHVKDVFECVTGSTAHNICRVDSKTKQPLLLRDICVQRIADLPYGEKILEELASVSERLQTINTHRLKTITSSKEEYKTENMPYYPLPDLSVIEKVSLPVKAKDPQPPPVKPRNSSLKKSQDDNHWTGVPTKTEPVYICLSPSQKMLMEKTNTIITKEDASQLVDIHKKYVDRRGYNEPNKNHHDNEKVNEPPFVPFKSQTGSRLLALIRDPSVTNISQASGDHNYSSEKIRNNYSDRETTFKNRIEDKRKFGDFTNSFKPIPPPRPKKYSSSFYESDESSDFTDNSLRSFKSERKYFHYSTGNLSKDIENDISSIQNMHRYYNNIRDSNIDPNKPRRPSLPKDICDQQMEYIRKKEKEVEAEIRRLEQEKITATSAPRRGPKAPLISEREVVTEKITDNSTYYARNKNVSMSTQPSEKLNNSKMSSLFSSSQEELLRDKMYSEYVNQMAERQERKQHKIIKITNPSASTSGKSVSRSMPAIDTLDSKVNNRIEKEFICKARERWNKLGITDPDTEDEREKNVYREPKVIEHKIKVIDGGEEKDVKKLPTHIQEFVNFTAKQKEQSSASSGESDGPASPHVVICAVIIVVLSIARYFIRLFRNI